MYQLTSTYIFRSSVMVEMVTNKVFDFLVACSSHGK